MLNVTDSELEVIVYVLRSDSSGDITKNGC